MQWVPFVIIVPPKLLVITGRLGGQGAAGEGIPVLGAVL